MVKISKMTENDKITYIMTKLEENVKNNDFNDLAIDNGFQLDNYQDLLKLLKEMIITIDCKFDRKYYSKLLKFVKNN